MQTKEDKGASNELQGATPFVENQEQRMKVNETGITKYNIKFFINIPFLELVWIDIVLRKTI